jgi:hypothetical protein
MDIVIIDVLLFDVTVYDELGAVQEGLILLILDIIS